MSHCLCALVSVISTVYCGTVSACPWTPVSLWVSVFISLCVPVLYILLVSVSVSVYRHLWVSLILCLYSVASISCLCVSLMTVFQCLVILVLEGTWISAYPEVLQSVSACLCGTIGLCVSVSGDPTSLCVWVFVHPLFSVHPWFFTCPWTFAYSWVLMCPWVIVHPWVCMSLNLYTSLSLSIWTSVCCMSVSGCPWASMLQCLCVFYLRASIPKSLHILEPLWSTGSVSQGLCIPVSGCLWASVLQCLCSWIMCKCLLPCTFCWWVSESVHLWHFALHVCDLAFTVILHLLSPVFANVSVYLFLDVAVTVSEVVLWLNTSLSQSLPHFLWVPLAVFLFLCI